MLKTKNKYLLLLLSFALMLAFGTVALAETVASEVVTITKDNVEYTVPAFDDIVGDRNYTISAVNDSNWKSLLVYDDDVKLATAGTQEFIATGSVDVYSSRANSSGEVCEWVYSYTDSSQSVFDALGLSADFTIIASTGDVYKIVGGALSDVVFFKAPRVVLSGILTKTELTGALSEILLVVPLVLLAVVSYLGLRKCLSFLSSRLRQA